ncbi:AMP-binding protein [Falsihalocynthiibacter sp. BN13B15]|uniref:AMP-binding protein n=1 Tax=Falsihalocynthiibacter sp. BN13B15 TaxID=3240871 RepID=UPI00350FA877
MTTICSDNHLFFGETAETWASLRAQTQARLGQAEGYLAQRCVFVVDDMRAALGVVAFGISNGAMDFGVVERNRLSPEVNARFAENGVRLVDAVNGSPLGDTPVQAEVQAGRVTVLTSGTTGLLKLIPHTADTLNTFVQVRDLPANNWFMPYQIGSYAWYQMVALGLFVREQGLIPADFDDLAGSFEAAMRAEHVTAISSTPTFWRHALMSINETLLAATQMRSISMGGEIVDQTILDRLAGLYPAAKIRHIYASSEVGAAIVVTDGKSGFDAQLLGREDGKIGMKIQDGRLFVRSPYANHADAGGWIDTGDLVEEREGRVYFGGRAGNTMINVGGQKAFPPDIEAHLLTHPDVVWAQVTARRAPMVGHLPQATIVLSQVKDADAAEAMLIAHCEGKLADYATPRIWNFIDSVPLRASLKS